MAHSKLKRDLALCLFTMLAVAACKQPGGGASSKSGGTSGSSSLSSGSGSSVFVGMSSITSGFASGTTVSGIYVPSNLDAFDCFAVNVVAADIKQVPVCGGMSTMGVAVGFFRRGTNIEMNVPFGNNRTFQVWGFANSDFCNDVVTLVNAQRGVNPAGFRSAGYLLAEKTVNISTRQTTVDLNPVFTATSPVMCGKTPNPVTTIVSSGYGAPGAVLETALVTNGGSVSTATAPTGFCVRYTTTAASPVFSCSLNGAAVACAQGPCDTSWMSSTTNSGVHHISGLAEGQYTFQVSTRDNAVGLTETSPPSFTFRIDDTAPALVVDDITPGYFDGVKYYTSSLRPTFKVHLNQVDANDTDDAIIRANVHLAGAGGTATGAPSQCVVATYKNTTYNCPIPLPNALGAVPNTVRINAVDDASNTAANQDLDVVLDQTAPSCTLDGTDSWWPMGGNLTTAIDPEVDDTVVGSGVLPSKFRCTIDGTQTACSAFTGFTYGGKHIVKLQATDRAGNTSTATTTNVYVDNTSGMPVIGRLNPSTHQAKSYDSDVNAGSARLPDDIGFYQPGETVLDAVGRRLFVADTSNNRVLVFSWDATTRAVASPRAVAVLGQPDFLGNLSGATDATVVSTRTGANVTFTQLNAPYGLAVNSIGTKLFVSDTGNHRVLRFDISDPTFDADVNPVAERVFGQLSVASGTTANHGRGCTRDNSNLPELAEPALADPTDAMIRYGLCSPMGMAYFDASNRLYVADLGNCRVVAWNNADTAAPTITASAISVGPAISFQLGAAGELLNGATFWSCQSAALGDLGAYPPSDRFSLSRPTSVAVDATGLKVYVADTNNHRVAVWDTTDGITDASAATAAMDNAADVAGTPDTDYSPIGQTGVAADGVVDPAFATSGDNTAGTGRTLTSPTGVAVMTGADTNRYLAITSGTTTTPRVKFYQIGTVDGTGLPHTYEATWNTGSAGTTATQFLQAQAVSFDLTYKTAFVTDRAASRVGVYSLETANIANDFSMADVLGHASREGLIKSFTARSHNNANETKLYSPTYSVADTINNRLYVSDTGNNRIMIFPLDSTTKRPWLYDAFMVLGVTYSGLFPETALLDSIQIDNVGGSYATSRSTLNQPKGLVLDSSLNLWVADSGNNRVVRFPTGSSRFLLDSNGQHVPIVADVVLGQSSFTAVTTAVLDNPTGIGYDSGNTGRLFISSSDTNDIAVYIGVNSLVAGSKEGTAAGSTVQAVRLGGSCAGGTPAPGCLLTPSGVSYVASLTDPATTNVIMDEGILVADSGNHRVVYYDLNPYPGAAPNAAACWGKRDPAAAFDVTGQCTETAISSNGHADGAPASDVTANGTWSLNTPMDVMVDRTNRYLYVTDRGNSRVAVYDLDDLNNQPTHAPALFAQSNVNFHVMGQLSQTVVAAPATAGTATGLNRPTGIFRLEATGNPTLLYIVDENWHRVGIYEVP